MVTISHYPASYSIMISLSVWRLISKTCKLRDKKSRLLGAALDLIYRDSLQGYEENLVWFPNPLAPGSDIQIHVSRGTRQGKPWMSTQLWLQNLSFLNYLDLRRTAIRLHHFGITSIACLHPRNHKMANSLRTRDKATQTDAITCLCEQTLLASNVGQQTKRKLIDFLLLMGACTNSLLCPCPGISLARPTW